MKGRLSTAPHYSPNPLPERCPLPRRLFNTSLNPVHPARLRRLFPQQVPRLLVRQRAKELGVHPASADECAQIFIDSAITSGLGTLSAENLALINAGAIATLASAPAPSLPDGNEPEEQAEETEKEQVLGEAEEKPTLGNHGGTPSRLHTNGVPNADVRVNLTVDSSSDPDKLEKQLKLLKQFGLLKS